MKLHEEKPKEFFRTSRIDLAEDLRRAANILERDNVGGLESSGRRIVDIAGEIGELIDWKGEGFDSPTSQGYIITKVNQPAEQAPAQRSPEVSEVPK